METYRELSIDFPKECESLRQEVHEFAKEFMRRAAAALDRMTDAKEAIAQASPLWTVLKSAYGMRYHAAMIPKHLGGLGLSALGIHVLLEELGWGSAGLALGLVASNLPMLALMREGRSDLIDRFVKPFAENRDATWIGCWAVTEPRHGSDYLLVGSEEFRYPTSSGQLVARTKREHYLLDGRKAAWIANGTIATYALCSVATEPSKAGRDFVIVPLDLPGVSRGEPLNKLGQRELNQGALIFKEVTIPEQFVLRGEGYEVDMARLISLACSSMAAVFTGTARAAYEEALEHSKQRKQGGSRICDHQLVRHQLFDLYTRVEATRAVSRSSLIYNFTVPTPSLENAIAAKNFCTRTAFEVADQAMQLFGGKGISAGQLIEKLFRDARMSTIEQGVNEVLGLAGADRIIM